MRSKPLLIVLPILLVLIGAAAFVYIYDNSHKDKIAKGVRVAGVDVGGLSPAEAEAKVRRIYVSSLARPVRIHYGKQNFTLTAHQARVIVAVQPAVEQALERSRQGNILSRTWRGVTGGTVDAAIQPRVTFGRAPVTALVHRITRRLSIAPKDASVAFTGDTIGAVAGHYGRTVQSARLERDILAALRTRSGSRLVTVHSATVKPKVTTAELAQKYPTVITIDRAAFRLRLWKNLHLVKSYGIAVGRAGLETPAGLYHIQDKQVNPSWHVPNSAWAGSLAGQIIPPGPADPIKARWMGVYNGAGIHGTDETGSIGSAASHGCIRMLIPDVIELYDQTPLGAPVYIA